MIVGEILPGVTADNLHAPVRRPFNHQFASSRTYYLDAPDGTGKTLTIRTIQAILEASNDIASKRSIEICV